MSEDHVLTLKQKQIYQDFTYFNQRILLCTNFFKATINSISKTTSFLVALAENCGFKKNTAIAN